MVKVNSTYECEICHKVFENNQLAEDCENKGLHKPYKIGMIYSTKFHGDIVFAVVKRMKNGHGWYYSVHACRDNGYGDDIEVGKYCGLDSYEEIQEPKIELDAYRRIVNALNAQGIKPSNYKKPLTNKE